MEDDGLPVRRAEALEGREVGLGRWVAAVMPSRVHGHPRSGMNGGQGAEAGRRPERPVSQMPCCLCAGEAGQGTLGGGIGHDFNVLTLPRM